MRLTAKQEKFIQTYAQTGNASQSYRSAYNAENMKDASVWVNACQLLKNTKVALRLKELRERSQQRHDVTIDTLTAELNRALEKAMKDPKGASAAVAAIMAKGKLHGLVVEKKEVTKKRDASDYLDDELYEIAGLGRARTPAQEGSAEEPDSLH